MKYSGLFALSLLLVLSLGFVGAENLSNSSSLDSSNSSIPRNGSQLDQLACLERPTCEGSYDTGRKDDMGCPIYECRPIVNAVTEQVACIFANTWGQTQKCYSSDGKYSCSVNNPRITIKDDGNRQATVECYMKVTGESGKKIDWKSSCGTGKSGEGREYTVIDGDDEAMNFDCSEKPANSVTLPSLHRITEQVKCVFTNSTAEQECFGRNDINGESFGCKGISECIANVSGVQLRDEGKYETMTWKSTCNKGYAFTTIDGKKEYAEFYCGNETKVETNLFDGASWQCHGGAPSGETNPTVSIDGCRSPDELMQYARDACQNNCDSKTGKCGVNLFQLGPKCGRTIMVNPVERPIKIMDGSVEEDKIVNTQIACNGCLEENKCYPIGYRKDGQYCTIEGNFITQFTSDVQCNNNFECGSNVCVNNTCVNAGLIDSILAWFSRVFGNQ